MVRGWFAAKLKIKGRGSSMSIELPRFFYALIFRVCFVVGVCCFVVCGLASVVGLAGLAVDVVSLA